MWLLWLFGDIQSNQTSTRDEPQGSAAQHTHDRQTSTRTSTRTSNATRSTPHGGHTHTERTPHTED